MIPADVHIDFATLLSLLTVLTGLGWALDKWVLAPRRAAGVPPNAVVEFARSFFPVIAFVLVLRSFIAEPFRIPSGSMLPTLSIGDFILVNKFAYGLRDPVFHTKYTAGRKPERGDIVVFRYPLDPSLDYIKRLVGLPGDRIAYRGKRLSVNGRPVTFEPDAGYTDSGNVQTYGSIVYREALGEGVHSVLLNPARPADDFEFVVPEGEYFMLGDNRDGSQDSRYWGTVPERNLVGRAFFVWMSWDGERNLPAWSRIGTVIH